MEVVGRDSRLARVGGGACQALLRGTGHECSRLNEQHASHFENTRAYLDAANCGAVRVFAGNEAYLRRGRQRQGQGQGQAPGDSVVEQERAKAFC